MRPADWSAVDLSSDPVPGDPAALERGGNDYADIARAIARTSSKLRSLALGGELSEAIDALSETANKVADDIAKAEGRYRETGAALLTYSRTLADAQTESLDALYSARSAREAEDASADEQRRYLRLSTDATDAADALRYENLVDSAASDGAQARSRIAEAQQRIRDAQNVRDTAADEAIDRIRNTTSHDGLKDSWWDNWGSDVLAAITDVAGWVATVAGVLALVVCWIPVIGQVLAAALLLVAGIAAVVNAIGNTVLASTGERTWTEAVISIVGAALSVVGLGSAARIVGSAAAAGRINALARVQVGFADEALTVRQALRIRPSAMAESEALWRSALPNPSMGDEVYRLYGTPPGVAFDDAAHAWGASYSPTPPWTLTHPREALGLPNLNAADNLLIAQVTDANANKLVRHALPLDGMPGGAPEYIFPGPFGDGKGLEILENLTFVAP